MTLPNGTRLGPYEIVQTINRRHAGPLVRHLPAGQRPSSCGSIPRSIASAALAMKYTIVLEYGRESGYVVKCPALPGCISQGPTKKEALRNIREAIEVYVAALLDDGLPVPREAGKELIELDVIAR